MRKLLSLVLAFAMILGTFAFPVSADGDSYQAVGEELKALGVLSGDQNGDLKADNELTREEALVVLARLMGKLDEAQATEAESGFADVPAGHWAAKIIAYAKAQKWVAGKSETEFGLGQKVTTKEALSFMMRALGYEADWAKEDIMKKASELGLMKDVTAEADKALLRGELFIVMKNTLYTKPMGEKTELIYKLGLAENPVPETLEVVDVKATNLREVVVEFNQEVDKTTLEDAFSAVGYTLGKITPYLQEDGKTVVLTVGRLMKNKENYKLTVSKVKSLSGVQMEKVTKEFKTEDNETPKVEKLVVTGPKHFQVVFSEPIDKPGTVKIKLNGKTVAGVAVKQSSQRVFDATVAANLQDGKTYTVLVTGFQDYAKYKNIDSELELEYAKVTEAPTAEVVKAEQEYVVVKFDRPVKGLTKDNFYHTYSAWKPVATYLSMEAMEKDSTKTMDQLKSTEAVDYVVLRFIHTVEHFVSKTNHNLHPLQVGEVEFNVLGQRGATKVVDNWGNQLQDTEIKVSVSADKEAPVVEDVQVVGEKEIEILFSKRVLENRNNFEILNENGGKISGLAFTTSQEGKKIKINVGAPGLVGKTVILNVKDVKDDTINMNKMVGTESFNLTFGDKTFLGIKEAILYLNKTNKQDPYYHNPTLFVSFKEAVDPASAMDIKNYLFTKDWNVAEPKKSFFGIDADTSMYSDTVVQIVMTRESFEKRFGNVDTLAVNVNGEYEIEVYLSNGIKDLAGNSYNAFSRFVRIKDAATPPVIVDNEVNVTGYRTVEYSYDIPVMTKNYDVAKKQFAVFLDNNMNGIFNDGVDKMLKIESVEFNGSKGVKIQLENEKNNDFRASANAAKVVVVYTPDTSVDKKDIYITNELGEAAAGFVARSTGSTVKIKDRLAPALIQKNVDATDDIDYVTYEYDNGYKHIIKVHFNEAMDKQTFSIHTFKVTGRDGTEYKPQSWELSADSMTLSLFFNTTSKASIDTLAQELGLSYADNALKVVTRDLVTNVKTEYFTYFNIQLQDFNSARDTQKNGFGSTAVYPVYHTKAEAESFVNAAKDLEGLKVSDLLNLQLMREVTPLPTQTFEDVSGASNTFEAAKIVAGLKFKAQHNTVAGVTPVYEWKLDGVKQASVTNEFTLTTPGKVTVSVSVTVDGKTSTDTVSTTVVSKLDALNPTFTAATPQTDNKVGTVELAANLMKNGANNAQLFVNNAPTVDQTTFGVVVANAPGHIAYTNVVNRIVAKAGDVVTLIEYGTGATDKVVAAGSITVEDANIVKWDSITTSTYLASPKAGFNKIPLTSLLAGDTVELFKNGETFGKLENIASATPSYELAAGQSIAVGDKFTLKITRNGQVSEMSGGEVPAIADSTTVTGDASGIQITEATGAVANSGVGDDGFIKLTLSEGKFVKDVQVSQFEIVEFNIVPGTQVSPVGYELQIDSVDRKPGNEDSVLLKVSKKGAGPVLIPSAATHYAFKIKVSGAARDGATADLTTASFQAETN